MVETLKKIDKKFLIIAGCIILLPILIIIFFAIMQGCNRNVTYEKYEEKMINAAEKYINSQDKIPTSEGDTIEIKLDDLIDGSYIKSPEELLSDDSCKGQVKVRRNGSSIESNGEGFLNFTVDLTCDDYKTVHLVDKVKENIVTEESGLHLVGEDYIFRGNKVNNYITLYDINYRIMSIDKDGIMKLIKAEPETTSRIWDNKFNSDVNYSYGKNIYKDSAILSYLISDYENPKKISKSTKQKIVAYDVCIGKRSGTDYSINKELDCSEVLENQVVSLINASDFAMASTDPDCNSTVSRSCKNYNYLSNVAPSGWTMNVVTENTYEVFYISDGLLNHQNANSYIEYNMVIYIDGNELYTEGTGSANSPYIIN